MRKYLQIIALYTRNVKKYLRTVKLKRCFVHIYLSTKSSIYYVTLKLWAF